MLLVSLSNPEYKRFEGKRMNEVIRTLGGDDHSTSCSNCWKRTTARFRPFTSTTAKKTCATRCKQPFVSPSAPMALP